MPESNRAAYVWPDPPGGRPGLDWVTFRRRFDLTAAPAAAVLHLFATHRYRLSLDGDIVGYGPARYFPGTEWHDTYDLRDRLTRLGPGPHELTVEACFIDANNFQHAPEPRGRFLARGQIGTGDGPPIDLATPGAWACRRPPQRYPEAPPFSFAIGPVEVVDQRLAAAGGDDAAWSTPPPLPDGDNTEPTPRLTPYPTGEIITPTPVLLADLADDERRVGYLSVATSDAPGVPPDREAVKALCSRYAVCLHSPRDQTVTLALHWGPHFLNGEPLHPTDVPGHGNRQAVDAPLHKGWNLLCGEPAQLQARYPVLLGWPRDAGLTARSRPDPDDPATLRYTTPRAVPDDESWTRRPPATPADLPDAPGMWHTVPRDAPLALPAREMSWDRVAPGTATNLPRLPLTRRADEPPFTIVFDFGTEYLGHVRVTLDAPADTVLDLGYDERRRADGCLDFFATNPYVDAADRFVTAAGPATLETFNPRGGRYLQLTVRPPHDAPPDAALTLHAVDLRDGRCLPAYDRAAPAILDTDGLSAWTWHTGLATLRANTEDVYCDSPWRERGLYLGDSYVQSMVELLLTTDTSLARRALQLFAAGQFADGQLPGVVPSWLGLPHGDFTLIYPVWLHDFHAATGDASIVRETLPAVDRLLASPTWQTSAHSILWDATEANRLFIDWGVLKDARRYDENATLNALRIRALGCAATLHDAAGDPAAADRYRADADRLVDAFRARLWLDGPGRFAGGTADGNPVTRDVLHPNILALAFGLADAAHTTPPRRVRPATPQAQRRTRRPRHPPRRLRRAVLPQVRLRRAAPPRPPRRRRPPPPRPYVHHARPRRTDALGVPPPRRPRPRQPLPRLVRRPPPPPRRPHPRRPDLMQQPPPPSPRGSDTLQYPRQGSNLRPKD